MADDTTEPTTTVDIKVETPLPMSVVLTLGSLIEAAWPGSRLVRHPNEVPSYPQIIFRIDQAAERAVAAEDAAALRNDPEEYDSDITELGPEGIQVMTPEVIADAFLPVLQAAFKANPDAGNYLEFKLKDPDEHNRYVLTFARSEQQTPHALRMQAEKALETAKADTHDAIVESVQRLLSAPRAGRADTYADGVRAALEAMHDLGFGRRTIPEPDTDTWWND